MFRIRRWCDEEKERGGKTPPRRETTTKKQIFGGIGTHDTSHTMEKIQNAVRDKDGYVVFLKKVFRNSGLDEDRH